jgi:peroxiredoxin Q/BCP
VARRADIKTGYDCNSNCLFCVIGDKLFTGDRSTADVLAELKASRATCEDVVFTGAEVTIRPDFLQLVRAARQLGYRSIQIQTNGRMFAYPELCKRAVEAGANEFSPSVHGAMSRTHDALTRSKGSFDQITAAIRNLKRLGQRIVTNTVIARQNLHELPAMARMFVELGVDQFQLAFPHPTGHAATYFKQVVPSMAEAAPRVHEALAIGKAAGIACMAEAIPYCHMLGFEAEVAELHIPPTEIVYEGYVVPDYAHDRVNRGKTRFAQCATCRFEPICEGPWKEYPAAVGDAEFQPVAGARVIDAQVVLSRHLSWLGRPAPAWPEGIAREGFVALAFYPEDGSPGCTAEACSLHAGRARLRSLGITVVGVSPDDLASHERFAAAHGLEHALVADVDRALARAWGVLSDRGAYRRTTFLVDPNGRIAHVIADVDTSAHADQLADAFVRLRAPPRPLHGGEELVVLRRPAPAAAEAS